MEYLKKIEYSKDYFIKLHEYKRQVGDLEKEKEILLEKDVDINKKLLNINKKINEAIGSTNIYVEKEQTKLIRDAIDPPNILTILTPDELRGNTRCRSCLKSKRSLNCHLNKNWVMSNDGVFCPKCVYHMQPKGICIGMNVKKNCKNPEEFKIKISKCFLCKKDKMLTKCIHTEKALRGMCYDVDTVNIYDVIMQTNLFFCTDCIDKGKSITHLSNHFKKTPKKGIYFNKYNIAPRLFSCGGNPFENPNKFKYDEKCRLCLDGFYKNKHNLLALFKTNINIPTVIINLIFSYFDKIDYVKFNLL
jgi:hypothetical protein